ncbi:TPA: amino acid adenylation domain-containing protein, partial [Legionella pneumophila]|nr:amino acid adenylation domain-containing protein [Legionella pneumophila]HCC3170953.1 amino acid adenylation domain-containing protein [Legionella pneumophila]
EFMLKDTQAPLLLTQKALRKTLPKTKAKVVCLDEWSMAVSNYPTTNPIPAASANNLAYVIYTSGSTGQPKGVMVEHRGISDHLLWWVEAIGLSPDDRFLHQFSFGFDGAAVSLFWPLFSGAITAIPSQARLSDPMSLTDFMGACEVTSVLGTPAIIKEMLHTNPMAFNSVKKLMLAGEALKPDMAPLLRGDKLYNFYGPTENSIISTWHEFNKTDAVIPIGRPISNTTCYILDGHLQPVPIGVTGELYLGGEGLARGYLNRPELTAERFIANPFVSEEDKARGRNLRLYRTGDLCRYLEDGNIEYIGRIDNQVKIRGFRIELGEIETVLLSHAAVKEAVVVAQDVGDGAKRLVGYYVLRPEAADGVSASDVRDYLKGRLPEYMVPSFLVAMEAMPLTPNGKLDRKALPAPEGAAIQKAYVAPRNALEEALVLIWQEVLGVQTIGVEDNFFELGGDSIVSIQMLARAHRQKIHLRARDVFQYPTIRELSGVARMGSTMECERVLDNQGDIPLLPIQSWFIEQKMTEPNYFNQSQFLALTPETDLVLLKRALAKVFGHHDAFRIRYDFKSKKQWYATDFPPFVLEDIHLEGVRDFAAAVLDETATRQANLDIEKGLLYRAALIHGAPDGRVRLFLAIHHWVVDGVSWRILLEDLEQAYDALRQGKTPCLDKEKRSYKEWAQLLNQVSMQDHPFVKEARAYWLDQTHPSPILFKEDILEEVGEDCIELTLSPQETEILLKELPQAYHTQINDILLTALVMAYCKWSYENTLTVHLEGHGREGDALGIDYDLSRTMGWFTSLHPVYFCLEDVGDDLFRALKQVKEQLRAVPGRGLGYGLLRYCADKPTQDALRAREQPGMVFNYLGQFRDVDGLFQHAPEPVGPDISGNNRDGCSITWNSLVRNGRFSLAVRFHRGHFRRPAMASLLAGYEAVLKRLINERNQAKEAQWLTPSDLLPLRLRQEEIDHLMPVGVIDAYPLTPMQEGLLYHSLKDEDRGEYIVRLAFVLNSTVNEALFRQAWHDVVNQYDSLRVSFVWLDVTQSLQRVEEEVTLPWEVLDWRDKVNWREDLAQLFEQEGVRGFDLTKAPLMRFYWISLSPQQTLFVFVNHHLLLDGWSSALVLKQVMAVYRQLLEQGRAPSLSCPRYRDYVHWLIQQDREAAKQYWVTLLSDGQAGTALPIQKKCTTETLPLPKRVDWVLTAEETRQLNHWVKTHGLTINTLIQGAWGLLLHRYTGQEAVVFGQVVSGRAAHLSRIEEQVGLLINTIPLKIEIRGDTKGLDYLHSVQNRLAESQQYAYVSLSEIQRWIGLDGRTPLVEHLVVFENYPIDRTEQSALAIQETIVKEQTNYSLNLIAAPGDRLSLRIEYDNNGYQEEDMARLMAHVQNLLWALVRRPDSMVRSYWMLSAEERQRLLIDWNKTERAYPQDKTVHGLFEEQVGRTPDNVAVVYEEEQLTYRELNAKANQLAHYLREQSVGPEVLVAIACERSLEMVIGILGI